jgi:vacuolar protein sorting-associated protein 13A/C
MVFEGVLTQVLNRFLGAYVENLDTNQLRVGIWGGMCSYFQKCGFNHGF